MISRRHISLALMASPSALWAQGQTGASGKLMRVIVPVTAGSATDIIARVVAERLGTNEKFRAIVENKAGAGTTIGAAYVAASDPDGRTILANSNAQTTAPWLFKKLPFDPHKDFVGVAPLASLANVLLVSGHAPWQSVAEFLVWAKQKKSLMNYASAGYGTGTHLNAEKFRIAAGLSGEHVPFKGSPEAITAVASGDVDWFFAPAASAVGAIKSGRVRALATGSPRRSPSFPQLMTTEEAGVPNSGYDFWTAFFVPAATPAAVVEELNKATREALASPALQERFMHLGAEPLSMGVEAFRQLLRHEEQATAQLVKAAGIRPIE